MSAMLGLLQRWLSILGSIERCRYGEATLSRTWRILSRSDARVVTTRLHGRRVRMLLGNPYLRWTRRYPLYNAPLVQLVHVAAQVLGRRVHVVDVGAAVGDTALLLLSSCEADVASIICVEGDHEFASMLSGNVRHDPRVSVVHALLTDELGEAAELVRTHAGTASPQGGSKPGSSFDDLVELHEVDVLKIDTDGYDGRVLGGAQGTLLKRKPLVVFEWHPGLMDLTGSSPLQPFEVLQRADYDRTIWFLKDGHFSHVQSVSAALVSCQHLADVCRELGPADVHYDVVALPRGHEASSSAVAALTFARRHRHHG